MWCALLPGALGDVQRDGGIAGEGAEEFLEQLGIHLADLVAGEYGGPGEEGAAGEIDRGVDECFVHGHGGVAVAPDAALVADGAGQCLAEDDADILGGVMKIDMGVADGFDLEVEHRVTGEGGQHMVEEADAGLDLALAGPVEVEPERDLSLRSVPG